MEIGMIRLCAALLLLAAAGWFANDLYSIATLNKKLDGLWFNNWNLSSAKEYATNLDDTGQWVCINVDKTMDYPDCVDIAAHECGHELFARKCEKSPELCIKLEQELK